MRYSSGLTRCSRKASSEFKKDLDLWLPIPQPVQYVYKEPLPEELEYQRQNEERRKSVVGEQRQRKPYKPRPPLKIKRKLGGSDSERVTRKSLPNENRNLQEHLQSSQTLLENHQFYMNVGELSGQSAILKEKLKLNQIQAPHVKIPFTPQGQSDILKQDPIHTKNAQKKIGWTNR